jgi:hypothetical protein
MSMQGMPQPTAEHKQLERLVGRWSGEEKLSPSPWGPGGVATGKFEMRLDIDGFFVIQDYVEEKDGRTVYRGHGIIGYDTTDKSYAWYWVDSIGFVPAAPSRGKWQGDTMILEHPPFQGSRGRYTFRFFGPDEMAFSIENSRDDGKTWTTFMEGRYRRA